MVDGAVLAVSPPSYVFTSGAAVLRTAVDMVTAWMDSVVVMRAGRVPPATRWCVSHQTVVLTVSVLTVSNPYPG